MEQQFKSLLSDDPELRVLVAKARDLAVLQQHFTAVAPPHLVPFSQVASLQSGTLNIFATNAAIAAKLRQLTPELVVKLKNSGCEVSGIRVKVQVSFSSDRPESTPRKLGKTAQNALIEFSQTLDDSPLKLALTRIIETKE